MSWRRGALSKALFALRVRTKEDDQLRDAYTSWFANWARSLSPPRRCAFHLLTFGAAVRVCPLPLPQLLTCCPPSGSIRVLKACTHVAQSYGRSGGSRLLQVGAPLNRRTCCLPSAEASAIFSPESGLLWLPTAGSLEELVARMDASIIMSHA